MKFLKYIAILFVAVGLSACGDDFLEINPSNALPTESAIQTLDDLETVLIGAYSQMQNSDYYGRYFILVPDVMGDDVKQNASANRAKEWAEYNGTDLDFISEEIWTEIYEVVNRANTVINSDVEVAAAIQADANQFKGEAYAIRALAHFDVCRIYAQHYGFTADASHPGVPIVTEFDETAEPSRASVGAVYSAVLSDLDQAISLMTKDRGTGFFSSASAKAIKARIQFYMEDYAAAAATASDVISTSGVSLTGTDAYLDAWAGIGTPPDALLEVIMTESDNNGSDALGRMYINEGYGDYLPSEDLLNILDSTDLRSELFKFDETIGGGIYGDLRMNKFPSTRGEDNSPVIRLSEIYLIRAESRARTGDEAGAMEDLMAVRLRAWPTAPAVTATGADLIEEIITERRREFAFEGVRLWDLMRLKRGVVRDDCTSSICEIAYPNDRFILPVPQQEIAANPSMVQNPGY